MKRILFITHVLDGSGAPRSLLNLLKHMPKDENLEKKLIGLRWNLLEKEFKNILGEDNVFIINPKPPKNKFLKLIERVLSIPKIAYLIYKINPDIVFINSAANSRTIFLSKFLGYKVYLFVHEFDEEFAFMGKIRRKFINLADKVLCLSNKHKYWLSNNVKYKRDIIVLPNGINLKEIEDFLIENPERNFFKFKSKFKFLISSVGFLSYRKGWDYLLEIIKNLKSEEEIGFVIIGDFVNNSEKEKFLKEVKINNLAEKIYITGLTSNVFKYLKYSDLNIITSRSEVFPLVVLECMSLGVPIVFFDVGSIRDIVPEDYSFKVNPYDIKTFIKYIKEIKNMDIDRKKELSNTLRKKVEEFDIHKISHKLYQILKEEF